MKSRRGSIIVAQVALLLPLGAGCSQVLDIPNEPVLVTTGPWRCLSQKPPPAATTAETVASADVRVQACNFITDCTTTVHGLTAQLCDKRDVGCLSPRLTGITEIDGEFRFEVPTAGGGFGGYLLIDSKVALCTDSEVFGNVAGRTLCSIVAPQCDVAAPDARCYSKVYAPAMLFFNPPIEGDLESPLPLQMFPISGLPSVIAAAGIQIDPTAGSLLLQALDCDGRPAAGVTYQIEQHGDQVSPLYVDNGIVSSTVSHTDTSGIGGFVRVPPGFISVAGYNSDGDAIGSIGVQASASVLTYSALSPSSRAP